MQPTNKNYDLADFLYENQPADTFLKEFFLQTGEAQISLSGRLAGTRLRV